MTFFNFILYVRTKSDIRLIFFKRMNIQDTKYSGVYGSNRIGLRILPKTWIFDQCPSLWYVSHLVDLICRMNSHISLRHSIDKITKKLKIIKKNVSYEEENDYGSNMLMFVVLRWNSSVFMEVVDFPQRVSDD